MYYANSINKIKSTFIIDTSVSGRTIYVSPFIFDKDCEMTYKFKSNPLNSWVIGFGSDGTKWNSKGVFFKMQGYNSNKNSIMWLDTSNRGRDAALLNSITVDNVLKINTTNLHRINWYIDNTLVAYRDTYNGTPLGIRFDIFDNMDYEIDYIKVKPL